jgi:phosphoserine phosphatase
MQKIKLVILDLDETLIEDSSWLRLNFAMGLTQAEDDVFFQLYSEGILDYTTWQNLLQRIYLKRGNPTRENIEKILFNYKYLPGAQEFVTYLKEKGYELAIVSGSINLIAKHVAEELGIRHYFANNTFVFDEKDYFQKMVASGNEETAKLQYVKELASELDLKPDEIACIGDGGNDIELFKFTGNGITFANSKIKDQAAFIAENLDAIRKIL